MHDHLRIATGDGRNGHVRSDGGILDTAVRMPAGLGGPGGTTNPEQLFATGYAACFHQAVKVVAGQDKLEKAHQVCPYSNATRGNIEVTLAVI